MPLYTKFLKDLLIKKGKYIHNGNIMVEGNCSAVIQRIPPPKYKDPGSVTIPCSIGVVSVGKALIYLGASINLMPLSMCRRIGNLEIAPTRMTLHLADHSITRPYGVVEDVLVKVRQFMFPMDFVIMDIEEDAEIPLILGCSFMLTVKCVVDMGNGNLEMSVDDQKVTFNLFDTIKHPSDHKACFKMKAVEHEVAMEEEKELKKCLEELDGLKGRPSEKVVFEELKKDLPIEKAKVDLKILPEHLKYVFLEDNKAKPIVISNSQTDEEESWLVKVLKKHRAVIG
ncbi:uncharacterized protein [Glycine max]|uniref:uncharacterized protein n=1 Tax=Glycine max TaxID=3847 RepID=UPI0003DE94FC|nr:uncharacterized protein LOC100818882 [Glycine max]|eukprot:XP_006603325.1 uncharacterized protein LOC100818882 [Glycine max]